MQSPPNLKQFPQIQILDHVGTLVIKLHNGRLVSATSQCLKTRPSLRAVLGASRYSKPTAFESKFTGIMGRSEARRAWRGDRTSTRRGLATRARAHQRRPWVLPRVWHFARRRVPYEGCASAARIQAGRKVRGGVSEDSRSYEVLPGEFG